MSGTDHSRLVLVYQYYIICLIPRPTKLFYESKKKKKFSIKSRKYIKFTFKYYAKRCKMSYYDYTYFIIVKFIMINKYILIVNIN
jgi:hypothetical protein